MTAVLKPSNRHRPRPPQSFAAGRGSNVTPFALPAQTRRESQRLAQLQSLSSSTSVTPSVVKALPTRRSLPSWLKLLIAAHRGSSVITFVLLTAVLTVYGWTVHSQSLWGREYRHLEDLQRQERQFTAVNEGLKNNLAQRAEDPSSGLIPANPNNVISLERAPLRPAPAAPPTSVTEVSTGPVGY